MTTQLQGESLHPLPPAAHEPSHALPQDRLWTLQSYWRKPFVLSCHHLPLGLYHSEAGRLSLLIRSLLIH